MIGGYSLEKMKSDPLPLTHLLDKWQFKPEKLFMVGDSKNDILTAKAAVISLIGLTDGYNYDEDIELSCPDSVCVHFNEILKFVNNSVKVMEHERV